MRCINGNAGKPLALLYILVFRFEHVFLKQSLIYHWLIILLVVHFWYIVINTIIKKILNTVELVPFIQANDTKTKGITKTRNLSLYFPSHLILWTGC